MLLNEPKITSKNGFTCNQFGGESNHENSNN